MPRALAWARTRRAISAKSPSTRTVTGLSFAMPCSARIRRHHPQQFFKCRAHSILTLAVRGRFYPERPTPKRRRGYPARSIASKLAPTGRRPVDVPEAEHANYYEGLPDPIEPNCATASLNANQHCIAAVMTLSRFNAPCVMESRISAGKSAGSVAWARSIAPGRSSPIWCNASETVVSGKPTLSAI